MSIRVGLALAAAAIASYIPGFLQIKSQTVRAGGALGVLVLVMFADDISRSLAPSSKIPGVPSNVKLNKDQLQFQSEIAAAQFDISQERYYSALETLNHAKTLNPDDALAPLMIGTIYSEIKNFTLAAETFEQGYKIAGASKARFAYNAALAYDALRATTLSRKWIDIARADASLGVHPDLWHDIAYDRGLIYMVDWVDKEAPKRTTGFEISAAAFNEFLDHTPKYLHWADYHLACLHAKSAAIDAGRVPERTYSKVVEHFDRFLHRIHAIVDPARYLRHLKIAQRVLSLNREDKDKDAQRGPLEPLVCPDIKNTWQVAAKDRNWNDLVQILIPKG